jgi:hypothetical protein
MVKNYMTGNQYARLAGRPKTTKEYEMKEDLRIIKINNCTKCIQDQVKC